MKSLISTRLFTPKILALIIILLTIPALLINLGLAPLIDDEGIRAMVAFEMKLRHNIIVPTIGGELYFNKPPVYNWILLGFFEFTKNLSYFVIRIPTVVFLYIYSFTIFLISGKVFGRRAGFIHALAFLTCGRMLFYDSFRGLIDTSFSWLIYMAFMSIYFYSEKGKYLKAFAFAYILAAVAFLMKGLPAVVFMGITVVTWFIAEKKFRILFSINHFIGIFLFLLITGSYYYLYNLYMPDEIGTVFATLFNESAKKSAVGLGWLRTLIHLGTFPFELIFHFIPWTLFVIYLFCKNSLKTIWNNKFLRFCLLTFAGNIVVYWFSPDTFPRYLFMLMPLVFTIFIQLHFEHELKNTIHFRVLKNVIFGLIIIAALVLMVYPFVPKTSGVSWSWLKSAVLLLPLIPIIFLYNRKKEYIPEMLIITLLISRIGFNWFIQTARYNETKFEVFTNDAAKVCEIAKGQELYYNVPDLKHAFMYELTTHRNRLLKFEQPGTHPGLYILNRTDTSLIARGNKVMDIHFYKNEIRYVLVKF